MTVDGRQNKLGEEEEEKKKKFQLISLSCFDHSIKVLSVCPWQVLQEACHQHMT
jgi:hypothetical protein